MKQIGFRSHLIAPYFAEIPPEIRAKWVAGAKKAAGKTYKGLKKAIKTRKDFREKMAKPMERTITSFTGPEFISKDGLTRDAIIQKAHKGLVRAEKGYRQAMKKAFESGRYKEKVEYGLKRYGQQWCRFIGPLKGYKNGHIKGLSALGVMALTGSKGQVDYLKEQKVKVEGEPVNIVIPDPVRNSPAGRDAVPKASRELTSNGADKLNQFRRKLDSRLVHWGSEIITQDYDVETINKANEEINQLVNEYIREGIELFSPTDESCRLGRDSLPGLSITGRQTGAVASHINFITEDIPNPAKPGYRIRQLGLDISVATM
ncbi:MAG: hypothetical protein AB1599_09470 [Planctomycetota bacterium]